MKWILLLISWIAAFSLSAQSEVHAGKEVPGQDTLKASRHIDPSRLDLSFIRMPDLRMPRMQLDLPNPTPDYNQLLQMNNNVTYSRVVTDILSSYSSGIGYGYGYGFGLFSNSQYMQKASFKLNNGLQINLYGDYNADGWKVNHPSAFPWEKNNYRGAFEVKSANGAFGFRVGVQRGYYQGDF